MLISMLFAALCAFGYLTVVTRPVGLIRSFIKSLSVGLLALAVIQANGPVFLIVALGFCSLGDWLLSRGSEATFRAGIVAFALGHLAYVVGFVMHPQADTNWLVQTPQLWIALGVCGVIMGFFWFLLRAAGALRVPVILYIPMLLGIGYAAFGLVSKGTVGWCFPAALCFILSDLALAFETFVLPKGHPLLRITPYVVWPLYWGAQVGFVIAFI